MAEADGGHPVRRGGHRQRDRRRDRAHRRRLPRPPRPGQGGDDPDRRRRGRRPLRCHGPGDRVLGRLGRQHRRRRGRARGPLQLHRQGQHRSAWQRLPSRHLRRRRGLRHAPGREHGADRALADPGHGGRPAQHADLSRRLRRARPRGHPAGVDREREGDLSRGLPVGPAAGQGGVPQGGRGRSPRRAQGGAHPVRPVLRRSSSRRVPRPHRAARRHPVRQPGGDRVAVRGRALRRRPPGGPPSLRDRRPHPQREGLGDRRRRRRARDRRRAGEGAGRHHRRRRPLRRRLPLRPHQRPRARGRGAHRQHRRRRGDLALRRPPRGRPRPAGGGEDGLTAHTMARHQERPAAQGPRLRNVAIIAHVDHGKTTLVDALFRAAGTFRANQQVAERALDRGEIERERGITILSKCTSLAWKGVRINIVDTPGHADFGGEVERIMSMVDGAIVVVDAGDGPMPQTKFVVAKALEAGLKPIVVLNKVDRPESRPNEALDAVFDLLSALGASDAQLDFPALYASAKEGWAVFDPAEPRVGMAPLLDTVLAHIPPPAAEPDAPFAMLATLLEGDPYLGRVLTGRIHAGRIRVGTTIKAISLDGAEVERLRVTKLLTFRGLDRVPVEEAEAGDIVALAGTARATVANTLADPEVAVPIATRPVDPPTLAMTFGINDSPLAGRDGDKVTSRMIRERLFREAEGNVAIRVSETGDTDRFEVAGRGELQLGVLIETLRRDGFELSISRPRVLFRADPVTGARLEPLEEILVDVDDAFAGAVVEGLSARRAELTDMRPSGGGKTRLTFVGPSRGLVGYHGEFLTATRGTGVMYRIFHGYGPHRGAIAGRRNGVLISNADGAAVAYALWNLEERGALFIEPGTRVYPGMIIGEHSRGTDLAVNPLKGKHLTNIRAAGKDDAVRLSPPRRFSLEQALAYIEDDELVEVTPRHVRLRKRLLDPHARKRAERLSEAG
ncbi:MAG: translational GTPase TypA [Proteobacteria bacterium]|nr:translational GTPase TypA [Pseudomonadota bacterium]